MPTPIDPNVSVSMNTGNNPILKRLLKLAIIPADVWDTTPEAEREQLLKLQSPEELADALSAKRMLTQFQASRVRSGSVNGLILGNFRVLDKIGSGGMGVVFRAEHVKLRTPVAVKALFVDGVKNRRSIERFFLEVRAVATLKHRNIVAAVDAGEEPNAGPEGQPVPYFVMEYVPGRNLDDLVMQEGPLTVPRACQLLHQIADALTEAHRQGLVHRDIKPSNIIVTPDSTAKLLDFGVARLPTPAERLTQDGARLGTIGYMAPEQARSPRDVDARADVFGLGATLFFALTGNDPFLPPGGAMTATAVPTLLDFRNDLPVGLNELVMHMMALKPEDRLDSAAEAMRELSAFQGWSPSQTPTPKKLEPKSSGMNPKLGPPPASSRMPGAVNVTLPLNSNEKIAKTHRVLIVDDEEPVRRVCRLALQNEPTKVEEVDNGTDAVKKALDNPYDLILLDVDLPGLHGEIVLRKIRNQCTQPHVKIMMFSGRTSGDDLARLLNNGADDFLTKPFSVVQLRSRVKAMLRLKDAQDRSDMLSKQLAASNHELERALNSRDGELIQARGAMVLAMAKLVEQRSTETGQHLIRLQRYCRVLAEAASELPAFAGRLDPVFVSAVEAAAPLHDIGKVGVPDFVLNKPGQLTADEKILMQTHTTTGSDALAEVSARYPFATGFFATAIEIARSHHERWDGTGYPDRLIGDAIPLSARLIALGDVYDALRSRRVYKPAFSHAAAVEQMLERSPGHFDPSLIEAFRKVAPQFERIFREAGD
ncbi:MAG: protein kinase domain-containing protein [Fimbriiglobus sp.]